MSAIIVNKVTFKYNTQNVLDNLSACIDSGRIYALLGPSGGGKTTLLRLILGRLKVNNGYISVFGYKPGAVNDRISYMPQNNALCLQFTVEQTFKYFMHIYRLSEQEFLSRYTKLQKLFELPPNHCVIHELSGGQQRRISLAAALISNATLVILDEPTVGIDLLLIQNIWKYLNIRCREGLSILFVTHYIEEATNAHKVGLMRNGRLLAEENPSKLIENFGEKTLESVFLKLCLLDNKHKNLDTNDNKFNNICIEYENQNSGPCYDKYNSVEQKSPLNSLVLNFWIILILIKRNSLKYLHMNFALICMSLPATQVVIYCLVFSKPLIEITAAVFNEELPYPEYSEDILNMLAPVDHILIHPVIYESLDSAISAVKKGSAVGAIWFKRNFSDKVDYKLENPLELDQNILDASALHLFMDNSQIMFANSFMQSLSETVWRFHSNLSVIKNQTNIEIPIKIEKTRLSEHLIIKDFGLPANLIFYIYLSQIVLSSLVLTQERKDGLFERSLIAGVSHHLVLISHFMTNVLLSIIQILLMYFTAFVVFREVNNGSDVLIIAYLLSEALNAITSGLLVSATFKEEYHCLIILGFLCAPQLFTSGMFWPLESLDHYLRYVSLCSPLSIPMETMRNIVLRGWGLYNPKIVFGFSVTLFPSFIYFILSVYIFKHRDI